MVEIMDYRTYVILFLLSKFGSDRSVSGIYHLLTGKKSSQTIQDGNLFGVLHFFNTMTYLTKENVYESIFLLEKNQLIMQVSKEHFELTSKGKRSLKEQLLSNPFPVNLNGWKYHKSAPLFWKRYSFMVQCLSNLIHNENSFLPITRDQDIQLWTKKCLPRTMEERKNLAHAIYKETEAFLSNLNSLEANYFVLRLTGKENVGLTHEQCSVQLKIDEEKARSIFLNILHRLLHEIESVKDRFHCLRMFISDIEESEPLMISTRKTYELLLQGKNLKEISEIRDLKGNTIEDHVVEIAINIPTFDIQSFVDREKQEAIGRKIKQLKTNRLKIIKEQLDNTVSYFQIRLVMTRVNSFK
jgi:uncharacterized protein YpbB